MYWIKKIAAKHNNFNIIIKKIVNGHNIVKSEQSVVNKIKRYGKDEINNMGRPDIVSLNGLSLNDIAIFVLNGYTEHEDILYSKTYISNQIDNIKKELKDNGYFHTTSWLAERFDYSIGDIVFRKPYHFLKYLLMNDRDIEYLLVNDELIKKMEGIFKTKIGSVRSLSAILERKTWLIKLEANTFKLSSKHEIAIAQEILDTISTLEFNFLIKEVFMDMASPVIEKYSLLYDEPYYILKRVFPKKFYYSTGNSMFIAKNEKLATMKTKERMEHVMSKKDPEVLSITELSLLLGINRFSHINHKNLREFPGDYFMYYNESPKHKKYLKEIFEPFLHGKEGVMFTTKSLRKYLEESDNQFSKQISNFRSFSFLLNEALGDDITDGPERASFYYKSNTTVYMSLEDLEEFDD